MTQDEKKTVRKSSLDTLIEELDEMFINAGLGGKSVQLEPDPTRHRMIVRMSRQKQAAK